MTTSLITKIFSRANSKSVFILIMIGIAIKILFLATYINSGWFDDSGSYLNLADRISSGNWEGYEAKRTPGYPLLMLALQKNTIAIMILQSVFGIFVSLMLFDITNKILKSSQVAFWVTLIYLFSINIWFMDAAILTESLCTLLLITACWLGYKLHSQESYFKLIILSLTIGFTIGYLMLTRPNMIILLIPFSLWVIFITKWQLKYRSLICSVCCIAVIAPSVLIYSGWSQFNKTQTGSFQYTMLLGYSISQNTGGFMEFASESDQELRDIYLKYRDKLYDRNIKRPSGWNLQEGTIFRALDEMLAATGLSVGELSSEMLGLNLRLISKHPHLYAEGVFTAWLKFGYGGWFVDLDPVKPGFLTEVYVSIWYLQHLIVISMYIISLITLCWAGYGLYKKKNILVNSYIFFLCNIVLLSSIFQALIQNGENARYGIPFQVIVLLISSYGIIRHRVLGTFQESSRDNIPNQTKKV